MFNNNINDLANKKLREKWKSLGFYFTFDENKKQWSFYGSKAQLKVVYALLCQYYKDPSNAKLGEHKHFGPYMILKIATWNKALINNEGIYGTLEDLKRLSNLLLQKIENNADFVIDKEYSLENESILHFYFFPKDINPASFDKSLESL